MSTEEKVGHVPWETLVLVTGKKLQESRALHGWGIVQTSALESPVTWLDAVVRSRAMDSVARRLPVESLWKHSGRQTVPEMYIPGDSKSSQIDNEDAPSRCGNPPPSSAQKAIRVLCPVGSPRTTHLHPGLVRLLNGYIETPDPGPIQNGHSALPLRAGYQTARRFHKLSTKSSWTMWTAVCKLTSHPVQRKRGSKREA